MSSAVEESNAIPRYMAFSQRILNELNVVSIDHCYSKPWSSHPDASNARPLQMLFMDKHTFPVNEDKTKPTDEIDVAMDEDVAPAMYDVSKAKALMLDCERQVNLLCPDHADDGDEWEDHIAAARTSWSVLQNRIFAKGMRVLQADRLARLSIQGMKNEPVQRRLQIDKAAKRIRFAFANTGWDLNLIMWLHNIFLEHLRGQLLTSYLEVLQTLKVKIPSLVDRLVQGTNQGVFTAESLGGLMKRTWDPLLSTTNQPKLKKLPDNPLLLVIPSAPLSPSNPVALKRTKFWHHQLSAMGKVINVVPINSITPNMTVSSCVENMITSTRSKILEMKSHFPGRPIVLVGWHVGSLVATHVAQMETVSGIVCLGFPTMGVNGNRGEIDDQIFNCKTPTLFIVGHNASSSQLDTIEDIRERLRVETGLVLVGGADDQLRMCQSKKRSCGVTQAMVDRCILDEVFQFLGNVLSQVTLQPDNSDDVELGKKQRKRKQKEITTAAGSQTSENGSSTMTSVKPMKTMKLSKGNTVGYNGQLALTGKLAKRVTPKKRREALGAGSQPKPMLHMSFPVVASAGDSAKSLSRVSEAAAIASAPELSNLLQSIKPSEQLKTSTAPPPATVSKAIVTVSSSATIPTTTALTLSRFLASSGLFRTGSITKPSENQSDDSETGSKSSCDVSPEKSDNRVDPPMKQPQILIRTGSASSPFTIPLTFTMANKVLKGGPVMKISGLNSPIIQPISTSSTSGSTTSNFSNVQTVSTLIPASSNVAFNLSSISLNSPVVSISNPTLASVANTPSIINIGTDHYISKESPPSTTPSTVSVDLGHITTAASSSNVKMTPTPKISLISKQVPLSSESLFMSTPQSELQTIATLSSLNPSQVKTVKQTSASPGISTQYKFQTAVSKDAIKPSNPSIISPLILSSGFATQHLSSTTGLITLKLSSPSVITPTPNPIPAKDSTLKEEKKNSDQKDLINFQIQNIALKPQSKLPESGTIISTVSKPSSSEQATYSVAGKTMTKPTSLMVNPANKHSTAQIVFQCRTTPTSVQQTKVDSPKHVISTCTETLGQVTSILPASPVRQVEPAVMGSSDESNSGTKQVTPSQSVAPLPSTSHTHSTKSYTKTTTSSYATTPKSALPTVASTRTRRIKTPKQYDL
ncbi:KAT8 regulatory NSL complex subunit 3-like [Physella acuta]|uniref:KAT8 regulatory NSL complex subunit 3-like n=1 Tax=Physella acuta TaxID=109671 RepID=UPI0027DC5C1D|nr:KAT8 regulatory NSL complex subunit 3-like [Physella acuta]XP_059148720.1 KAT8 regulatory NSL complex subunit 3-like [Physella acuta]XP_059148721.1 KAT8 regulatory NSL complex subunit 3-like [Physella acuta]